MLRNIDVYYDVATKCQIDGHKAAKEITSMVMEFVEWKDNMQSKGTIFHNADGLYSLKDSDLTTNELFQYWFNNIKK